MYALIQPICGQWHVWCRVSDSLIGVKGKAWIPCSMIEELETLEVEGFNCFYTPILMDE
jgi:hypothetical protein